uniref:Uncharacterized protein n=1 Tax=Rhizophora mucronata TaxID=61149 RepID=A0A2P2N8M7_RHIMU
MRGNDVLNGFVHCSVVYFYIL